MVQMHLRYDGELHCTAEHGPSGEVLTTDAPTDNMGKGETFSPTDLAATALGTCMLTTMGILAKRKGWNMDGLDLQLEKHMTAKPPRRIERLVARFAAPPQVAAALEAQARSQLEHAARTCPVALSLNPEIELALEFGW